MTPDFTAIAKAAPLFEPWTGSFDEKVLREWFARELSAPNGTRLLFPETIVHIVSGNTPHAAWQTLLRGLLLGAKNRLKLPSNALPEFESQLQQIPPSLRKKIEVARTLPDHWIPEADALIVYGNDATISHFRSLTPLEIPFIAHGHRFAVAIINDPSEEAARLAAIDICEYEQSGCLSLQTIYLQNPHQFAPLLASALEDYTATHPPRKLSPSEHGAITNLRHETCYLAAQEPESYALWQSEKSTAWTIVFRDTLEPKFAPGIRTITLKPLKRFQHSPHLSGIALHPYENKNDLFSPRIFPLGEAQHPPIGWAHDGIEQLRALVRIQSQVTQSG